MRVARRTDVVAKLALAVAVVAALLVPSVTSVQSADASVSTEMDLVFVVDESASMEPDIGALQQEITSIAAQLVAAGLDTQFGLVGFAGGSHAGPVLNEAHLHSELVDSTTFGSRLAQLQIGGGVEPGFDGVVLGADVGQMGYRSDSARCMVLMSDEDADVLGATQQDALDALDAIGSTFFSISRTDDPIARAQYGPDPGSLSAETGGQTYSIGDLGSQADQVFADLTDACITAPQRAHLVPLTADAFTRTDHTVTAFVEGDVAIAGRSVEFEVVSGPNTGETATVLTDAAGQASFTWTGDGGEGTDVVTATWVDGDGQPVVLQAEMTWWQAEVSVTKITTMPGTQVSLPADHPFPFAISNGPSFQLSTGTAGTPSTATFDLDGDQLTITESFDPDWELRGVSCSQQGNVPVTLEYDGSELVGATVAPEPTGGAVACYFVNDYAGDQAVLVVEKQLAGFQPAPDDFAFVGSGGIGSFTLDYDQDPTHPSERSFFVDPGDYLVEELVPEGWRLASFECSGNGSSAPHGPDGLTGVWATVAGGEFLRCTATNEEALTYLSVGKTTREAGPFGGPLETTDAFPFRVLDGSGTVLAAADLDTDFVDMTRDSYLNTRVPTGGTYTIVEEPGSSWQLDQVACFEFDLATNESTPIPTTPVTLPDGSSGAELVADAVAILCSFTNTPPTSGGQPFILGKFTVDETFTPVETAQTFTIRAEESSGAQTSVTVDTDESSATAGDLPPSGSILVSSGTTLTITEDAVAGWQAVDAQCFDQFFQPAPPSSYQVVTASSGEPVEIIVPTGLGIVACGFVNGPATAQDTVPPVTAATPLGTLGDNGWYTSSVVVDLVATDADSGVASITYQATGAQTIASTTVPGDTASVPVAADGTTTVTFSATDAAGNIESTQATNIKVDSGAPDVAIATPSTGATYDLNESATVDFACSDSVSGIATCAGSVANGSALDTSTLGAHSITVTGTDEAGNQTVVTHDYTVVDTVPPVTAATPLGTLGDNGWYTSSVVVDLVATDADSGVASITYQATGAQTIASTTVPGDTASVPVAADGTTTVTFSATDAAGNIESTQAINTKVDASAPTVGDPVATPNPVSVYETAVLEVDVSDATSGLAAAEWFVDSDPGQGEGELMAISGGVASATIGAGLEPGVYSVYVRAQDNAGNWSDPSETLLVVYDPEGGFVTGGGWIDSPAGAYIADPDATGKANFGFVSKYKKGATVPTGQTEFRFVAGDLDFHSTSYDWLVVTGGDTAKFKGVGTINGSGAYRFMIWATDDSPDTFRIKIWTEDGAGVETPVYDNGADQAIGGGNIVVHTKKK